MKNTINASQVTACGDVDSLVNDSINNGENHHNKSLNSDNHQKSWREQLELLPNDWALVPVRDKRPYRSGWQSEKPLSASELIYQLSNTATGIGLRLGDISGGLIAVDVDGSSADHLLNSIAQSELPATPMWTSGKDGRYQMLFQVPDKWRDPLKPFGRENYTEWNGYKCAKDEQLEIRYNRHQSVLPPSKHPETGHYKWIMSPNEVEIAIAPDWLLKLAVGELSDPSKKQQNDQKEIQYRTDTTDKTDEDWAREYLEALSPYRADYYDDWIKVGLALHSVSDGLFPDWERWSSRSSKYKDGECAKKWQSFGKGTKKATIATLCHMAKEDGWQPSRGSVSQNVTCSQAKQGNDIAETNEIDIKAEITNLISTGVRGADLNIAINQLAIETRYQPRELWNIYKSQLNDSEQDRETAKADTINLLNISKTSIKLVDVVDNQLAKPLSKVAAMMGGKDEAVLTSLLPVVASLISTESKLELIKATGFYAYPIIFTGIVGESGTAKSPLQKLVLKPLWSLQDAIEQDYRSRLTEWEEMEVEDGSKKPPKPTPLDLWTADVTSERVAEIMSNQVDQNQGLLIWKDELSALIKDCDAYKGGKGSDAEKLLSGRDGSPLKVDRCSKRLNVPRSSYSITGGIQPDTLKEQIDFSDPTGHWARFLLCYLPLTKRTFPEDEVDIDVNHYLMGIYKAIRNQSPQNYILSSGAKALYREWYNQLGERAYSEPRQGLRNVYSKMTRDTGVLALLLHCLNAAVAGTDPDDQISVDTMTSAIALSKFYIGQVKLIHAEGDADDGELSPLYLKVLSLSERKGWIKAKDLKMSDRSFRKMNANDIRSLFSELEAMGLGITDGKGNRLTFKKSVDTVDTGCQPVDNFVNQLEPPYSGKHNHKNNIVDTSPPSFTTPHPQVEIKDKTESVDKKDDQIRGVDNSVNQTRETVSDTELQPVDTLSTISQPVDNQSNEPFPVGCQAYAECGLVRIKRIEYENEGSLSDNDFFHCVGRAANGAPIKHYSFRSYLSAEPNSQ